jgi:hypothetical protein
MYSPRRHYGIHLYFGHFLLFGIRVGRRYIWVYRNET